MNREIADIRLDYKLHSLSEEDTADDPVSQFSRWWNDALASEITEVNAMTLATTTRDGIPSARIVLLKGFSTEGFVFFTNYNSQKGIELQDNPHACLVFFWKEIERQVRISGFVTKTSSQESDEYFQSRPAGSKIGAWSSPQSTVIPHRHLLEENVEKYTVAFSSGEIPRPSHWGGYLVKPAEVEFWQGRSNRLHDRIKYILQDNRWMKLRLAP